MDMRWYSLSPNSQRFMRYILKSSREHRAVLSFYRPGMRHSGQTSVRPFALGRIYRAETGSHHTWNHACRWCLSSLYVVPKRESFCVADPQSRPYFGVAPTVMCRQLADFLRRRKYSFGAADSIL